MVQIMQQVTFQFQQQHWQKQIIMFCCICINTATAGHVGGYFCSFVVWPRCEISWNDSTEMSQNLHKGTASPHDSTKYNISQVQGWPTLNFIFKFTFWIQYTTTGLKLHAFLKICFPHTWNSTLLRVCFSYTPLLKLHSTSYISY